MEQNFIKQLMGIGIVSYKEQETLFLIAKRCAGSAGLPMATAGGIYGATGGSFTIPGFGTVAGGLAGALAGLLSGTFSCTLVNVGLRNELKKLAQTEYKED